jgi:hypothetical protein
VTIPANALLFRSEGPSVGVVHPDGKVEVRKIVINRDLGDRLQFAQGLTEADQVIVNPSDGLANGMAVTSFEFRMEASLRASRFLPTPSMPLDAARSRSMPLSAQVRQGFAQWRAGDVQHSLERRVHLQDQPDRT